MNTRTQRQLNLLPVVDAALWRAWQLAKEALDKRFPQSLGKCLPVFKTKLAYLLDPDRDMESRDTILDEVLDLVVVQVLGRSKTVTRSNRLRTVPVMALDLARSSGPTGSTIDRAAHFSERGLVYAMSSPQTMDVEVPAAVARVLPLLERPIVLGQALRPELNSWQEQIGLSLFSTKLVDHDLFVVPETSIAAIISLDPTDSQFAAFASVEGCQPWEWDQLRRSRVDLVICTPGPFCIPVAIVEFDSPFHDRKVELDARKDRVVRAAGLPMIRLQTSADIGDLETAELQLGLLAEAVTPQIPVTRLSAAHRDQVIRLVTRKSHELHGDLEFLGEDFRALSRELHLQIGALEADCTRLVQERDQAKEAAGELHEHLTQHYHDMNHYGADPDVAEAQLDSEDEMALWEAKQRLDCGAAVAIGAIGLRLHFRVVAEAESEDGHRHAVLSVVPNDTLAAAQGSEPMATASIRMPYKFEFKGHGRRRVEEKFKQLLRGYLFDKCRAQLAPVARSIAEKYGQALKARRAANSHRWSVDEWHRASTTARITILERQYRLTQDQRRILAEATAAAPDADDLDAQELFELIERTEQIARDWAPDKVEGAQLTLAAVIQDAGGTDADQYLEWMSEHASEAKALGQAASAAAAELRKRLQDTPEGDTFVTFVEKAREARPRAHSPWGLLDEDVHRARLRGESVESIAQRLQRTVPEVREHLAASSKDDDPVSDFFE